jgi:hypothetical protein
MADNSNPPPPPPVPQDLSAAIMGLTAATTALTIRNDAIVAALAEPPPQPIPQEVITATLTALTNNNAAVVAALAALVGAGAVVNINPDLVPILQPGPLDFSSGTWFSTDPRACDELDETWDGTTERFPALLNALTLRANKFNWDAAPPHGILQIPSSTNVTVTFNLLVDYHQLTEADIAAACANHTDNRAKQNARAMYQALKHSLKGAIKTTLLQQMVNHPFPEDGVALFFRLTQLTVTSSPRLSLIYLKNILDFCPSDYKNYKLSTIHTQLNNYFVLATTRDRQILQGERIYFYLVAYSRILQPQAWARWISNLIEEFDNSRTTPFPYTTSQDLMCAAVFKYIQLTNESHGNFGSFSNSI